jgi:hypothetical protein
MMLAAGEGVRRAREGSWKQSLLDCGLAWNGAGADGKVGGSGGPSDVDQGRVVVASLEKLRLYPAFPLAACA